MKKIAKFYTYFWIVYFPTCIAFNELPGFGLIDEIMTVILLVFTLTQVGKRYTVKEPLSETRLYIVLLIFFVIYGLMFGANVHEAVFRDMVQWIRPFSVIYSTWILNPQFTEKQKNKMLYSMVATMVAWLLYHPEVQIGAEKEFVVLGQLAMCTGMAWYLWKPESRRNMYIAFALVLSGMLAPKFKYIGEVAAFFYMVFFLKEKLNFKSAKVIISITLLMALVIWVTWERFDAYYISGFDAEDRLARPETLRIAYTIIIWEYFPFGSGMGSWGCAAAADYYSPLLYKYNMNTVWGCSPEYDRFIADAFYPTLAQLGVVGIFFFCAFWRRRIVAFNKIMDLRYYRVAWITFFCLAIEQTADTSFLSGKGMGYCMLIAMCLNANRNMIKSNTQRQAEQAKLATSTEMTT